MSFMLIFGSTLFAAAQTLQTYHPGDVAVINNLIDNNGLTGVSKDDPENWSSIVQWNEDTPKRIARMNLTQYGLTGEISLSNLTSLQYLQCINVDSLNVSGLTNLENLIFLRLEALNMSGCTNLLQLIGDGNTLTTLDLSDCTSLQYLSYTNSNLGSLDVSNLVNLKVLSCAGNNISTLDVSNLINLQNLSCVNNKLTALDLTNLTSLGYSFYGDRQSVSLTLSGNDESGYSFAIDLNSPEFDNEAVSYAGGVLTSADSTVKSVNFTVETGLEGKLISGTMALAYIDNSEVTAIATVENANVKIYPNPVKSELKIESGELRIENVEILGVSGKKLSISGVQFSANPVNVSALPKGMYFIQIKTDKGVITEKFTKE